MLGRTTSFGYNSAGDLTSITAPGEAQTTFGYDSLHRVTTVTQPSDAAPGEAVTRFDYRADETLVADPNTDQSQPIDVVPNTNYHLDDDGRQLVDETTDPSGATRSRTYTQFSDVETATNPSGAQTQFGYDENINGGESLTGITSATDAASSYSYENPAGTAQYYPDTGTDAQGNESTFTYDGVGNLEATEDQAGSVASIDRNADGTLLYSQSPRGTSARTYYAQDAVKQVETINPPGTELGDRSYTYDPYGRIATHTNGRGITESYSYDPADRVTLIDYSDATPDVAYTYDSAGRVHTRADASGTTTYTYDPLGRLASRQHSAGGGLLSYGYDLVGNLIAETDGGGATTHSYDGRNLLESTTTPDSRTIRYAHDADGQRTDSWFATNTDNTTWAVHTETDFDQSGRITRITTSRDSDDTLTVSDLSYSYASPGPSTSCPSAAAAGDTSLRWKMQDHVAGNEVTYCYDTSNRLLSATSSDPGEDDWAYTYDVNGNRETVTKNGTVVQDFDGQFDIADMLDDTTGYEYDAAGNLTHTPDAMALSYTGSNQLQARTDAAGTSYTFAGTTQNELISQTFPGGETSNIRWGRTDRNGLPVLESFTSDTGTTYLWHDASGSPLAMRTYFGEVAYYALDGLGSPVALVNSDGDHLADYDYDPYGEVTISNLDGGVAAELNPYRFAGGLLDRTTGYLKYGQRLYDPATGRFTQQDSLEILADPTRGNRYQYAGSNPANYVDPTGLFSFTSVVASCASGAVQGLVTGFFTGSSYTIGGALVNAGVGCAIDASANASDQLGASGAAETLQYAGYAADAVDYLRRLR